MKRLVWSGGLVLTLALAGCGTEEAAEPAAEEHQSHGETLEEVIVVINTAETAESGEEVVLSATVTQGDEAVEDANEVMFEVWESGHRDQSEMIEGIHTEDGTYEALTAFEKEGLYYVQAHTTARGLHVMPKQELTVGNPDPASIIPDKSDDSEGMQKKDEHTGH